MKFKDKILNLGLLVAVALPLGQETWARNTTDPTKSTSTSTTSLPDEYLKATAKYNQFIKSNHTASPEKTKEAKDQAYSDFVSAQNHAVAKTTSSLLSAAFRAATPSPSTAQSIEKLSVKEQAGIQKSLDLANKISVKAQVPTKVLALLDSAEKNKPSGTNVKEEIKQNPIEKEKAANTASAGANRAPASTRDSGSRVSSTGVSAEKMESAEADVIRLQGNAPSVKNNTVDPQNPLGTLESVGNKPSDSGGADSFIFSPHQK